MRRKKTNKYEAYSVTDKLDKDPLDALIDESVSKNKALKSKRHLGRIRNINNHTTSDITLDVQDVQKPILFPDNRGIDPYDPSTYGFVELGTILGAHGQLNFTTQYFNTISLLSSLINQFPITVCEKECMGF